MVAPRVSVVMAVHDGERYVGAAVDSILTQKFRDLELIVVDDGSTDRSPEIVREHADPRVRLIANGRNLGLAPSLNVGLAEARGEFVARLDADDVAMPHRLARQVEFMDANPHVEARLTGKGTHRAGCGASSTVRAPYGEMGVRVPHARAPQGGSLRAFGKGEISSP